MEKSLLDDENLSILDMNESDSNSLTDIEFCSERDDLEREDSEDQFVRQRNIPQKVVEE